jgi:hypothetical protein
MYSRTGFYAGVTGLAACVDCKNLGDVYQDKYGQAMCTPCPPNSERPIASSSANRTSCVCKESFFRHDGLQGERCFKCPDGAICRVRRCCCHAHRFGMRCTLKTL